jgi:hypothetical protein
MPRLQLDASRELESAPSLSLIEFFPPPVPRPSSACKPHPNPHALLCRATIRVTFKPTAQQHQEHEMLTALLASLGVLRGLLPKLT